ncbi:Guanine nucleotide exchange factor lte1 [Microbotryomycetes sp. JL221]|nr:Guanine nucleotide exchange factor lte1 [Microbotryomycetes sp. JL221]
MASNADQAFVETTNKRAAEVLAAHYLKEGRGEHNVVEKHVNGKIIYCIRPRPRQVHSDTLASSNTTIKGIRGARPKADAQASQARALRHSRSIPALSTQIQPARLLQDTSRPSRTLRRFGSTPLLSVKARESEPAGNGKLPMRSQTTGPGALQAGDVFSKILGWLENSGSAHLDVLETLQSQRADGLDLPVDLRTELKSNLTREEFLAGTVSAPVFGQTVKMSRTSQNTEATLVRNAVSQETIRTSRALDRAAARPPRFQDPSVFDDIVTSNGPPSPQRVSDTRSMASLNSSRSSLSRNSHQQITVVSAPSDEPQFAVWGYKEIVGNGRSSSTISRQPHRQHDIDFSPTTSAGSPATTSSARWSTRDRQSAVSSAPTSVRVSAGSVDTNDRKNQPVLMAATVERLIAELTSKIDAELLVTFFLTFRVYLTPLELMHSLIARFTWAMQGDDTPEGEGHKRIVRVRTFVVLRHWLLNHFMDDFYPDRDLRSLFTSWLNGCSKDDMFRSSPKDLRLIKGLKKIVRKVKETYVVTGAAGIAQAMSQIEEEERTGVERVSEDDVDFELGKTTVLLDSTGAPAVTLVQPLELYSSESSPSLRGPTSPTLPFSSSSTSSSHGISRSLSTAVGKLKRLRSFVNPKDRRLSTISGTSTSDAGQGNDVLATKDQLERYLEALGVKTNEVKKEKQPCLNVDRSEQEVSSTTTIVEEKETDIQSDAGTNPEVAATMQAGVLSSRESSTSSDKISFDSNESPTAFFFSTQRPQSTRIQLDDIDLSDEDDDVVEAKRTLKRLPAAGVLRVGALSQSRMSRQTTRSSKSDDNFRAPSLAGYDRASISFVDDEEGYEPAAAAQIVPGFTLEGLDESDEEDSGGIEAALKRLEGIVDDTKEKEKARRVEQQMQKSANILQQQQQQTDDATQDQQDSPLTPWRESVAASVAVTMSSLPASPVIELSAPEVELKNMSRNSLANAAPTMQEVVPTPAPTTTQKSITHKPSAAKLFANVPTKLPRLVSPVGFAHKSFVMQCRTEVLAQQLCLIERDLFRTLKWQELTSSCWKKVSSGEVVDWETFLKDRRRRKVAAKRSKFDKDDCDTAVQAMIARFNLTANWVASEIVLTLNVDERATLVAKFIRLAFKAYCQSNYQTLTQIMAGLQIPEIEKLRKTWSRVPSWEMRKFKSLQTFVSHEKQFKHLRDVTNALIAEYGPPGQRAPLSTAFKPATSTAVKSGPVAQGCLPFLGLILRDLSVNDELPTFLDPMLPDEPAQVDVTGAIAGHADVVYPLVNVQKMRVIATVTQRVMAFQEFSEGYPFEVDSKVYLKALKLRALDAATLRQLAERLEV